AAVLLGGISLAACSIAAVSAYDPIPDSIWTPGSGLDVLSSKGMTGNECCDPNPGSRSMYLAVDGLHGMAARDKVTAALVADGWEPTRCQRGRSGTCLSRDSLDVYVGKAELRYAPAGAEVSVYFSRKLD
ncbi:MAG TPA: hypothetical protein VMT88_12875, partial [Actinomycetes bacterium]|nr:hypothetical protein [Actinomycetes bacterium]